MARSLPCISVVVCCYNGADVLPGCLEALQRQTWEGPLEIIVVDDGSVDGTSDVAQKYDGVRLIRNKQNQGLAGSRNVGIAAASGEIVAFTDDDCRPKPNWIAELYEGYVRKPDAVGVGGSVVSTDHSNLVLRYLHVAQPLAPLERTLLVSNGFWYRFGLYLKGLLGLRKVHATTSSRTRPVYSLVGANMSFRKHALKESGMFDDRFRFGGEEEDLCKRLNETHPDSLYYVPQAKIDHQYNPQLRDTLRRSRAYGMGNARMSRKHADVRSIIYPFPLAIAATVLLGLWHPLLALMPAVLIPLVYARWTVQAFRSRRLEPLAYSYIQCAQEWYSNVGFVKGWWAFRHLFPRRPWGRVARLALALVVLACLALLVVVRAHPSQPFALILACAAVMVPGYGVLRVSGIGVHLPVWLRVALSAVTGVVWIMAFGLALVAVLPLLGIDRPLAPVPVGIGYSSTLAVLGVATWRTRRRPVATPTVGAAASIDTWAVCAVSLMLPLVSALGAGLLNNGYAYGNGIVRGVFVTAMVLVAVVLWRSRRLASATVPLVLFSISLSALWSYALRSNHLFGWDIQQEYYVAMATQAAQSWQVGAAHSPYDAMLSLTVLPTVLSHLSGASIMSVFKVLFPVLFSFLPVIMYGIYRQFAQRWIAFSAALLTVAQFYYMQQFVALGRQQIAFLCFAGLLYCIAMPRLPRTGRIALGLAAIGGLVVSHYSTTYFAIVLLGGAYIVTRLIMFIQRDALSRALRPVAGLRFWMVASLICGAVLWYGPITQSSKGLDQVAEGQYGQVVNKSAELLDAPRTEPAQPATTDEYLATVGGTYRSDNQSFGYYDGASNDQVREVQAAVLPARWPGSDSAVSLVDAAIRYGVWIVGIAGVVVFLIRVLHRAERQRLEIALLAATAVALFVFAHVMPGVDGWYNVPRVNQQVLLFAALPAVLGIVWCVRWSRLGFRKAVVGTVLCASLAIASGLAVSVLGGKPTANMYNDGADYGRFFIHDSDVAAAQWLDGVYGRGQTVYADRYASLRFTGSTDIRSGIVQDITPETLAKGAYVYADYTNVVQGMARTGVATGSETFEYTFPFTFLNEHTDKLYNNGKAEVYR